MHRCHLGPFYGFVNRSVCLYCSHLFPIESLLSFLSHDKLGGVVAAAAGGLCCASKLLLGFHCLQEPAVGTTCAVEQGPGSVRLAESRPQARKRASKNNQTEFAVIITFRSE